MAQPDGGWYDETPPHVVSSTPADRGVNVKSNKITIDFDEFVKVDNPQEKVVFSPPQSEVPEVKVHGRRISITLPDTLLPNTTYTIDFSDAISDSNEGNPMGNYTYSFSTGDHIDTLSVEGYVLDAQNLEPIKGILVGLTPIEETPAADSAAALVPEASASGSAADSAAAASSVPDGTAVGHAPLLPAPFCRVSRTDSYGHFIIRGVAPGRYNAGAVMDMDGDSKFTQRGEQMAFSHEVIIPSSFPDIRQDTIWSDSIHIKDIKRVPYTHFTPDDVVLRAFNHKVTERYFTKVERKELNCFSLFFNAPLTQDSIDAFYKRTDSLALAAKEKLGMQKLSRLPNVKLLSPKYEGTDSLSKAYAARPFLVEPLALGDTINYWIRDTVLIETDSIQIELTTLATDTAGIMQLYVDTLDVFPKVLKEKRMKLEAKKQEDWQKQVEKRKKQREKIVARLEKEGTPKEEWDLEPLDTLPPVERLKPEYKVSSSLDPDGTAYIHFNTPMARIDTAAVHLYVEQDSVWFRAPFTFQPVEKEALTLLPKEEQMLSRDWELFTDWIPGAKYSLEIDTLAFEDIYGLTSDPYDSGITIGALESYSSLVVNISGAPKDVPLIVQIVDQSDKVLRTSPMDRGAAEFYYLKGGTYYLRAFADRNNNGKWDEGDFFNDIQPEEVYYNPEEIELKEKWDITKAWNITSKPLHLQKPGKLTKQKGETKKAIKDRNAKRAKEKGIPLPEHLKRN